MTYGRQGVAKYGTTKCHHAIIWSGSQEPQPQPNEFPIDGESGMMAPIRVVPKLRSDQLDPMCRVNFAKIYTVEHNVKVYNFGDVHKDFLEAMIRQWEYTLAVEPRDNSLRNSPIMPQTDKRSDIEDDDHNKGAFPKGVSDVVVDEKDDGVPATTEFKPTSVLLGPQLDVHSSKTDSVAGPKDSNTREAPTDEQSREQGSAVPLEKDSFGLIRLEPTVSTARKNLWHVNDYLTTASEQRHVDSGYGLSVPTTTEYVHDKIDNTDNRLLPSVVAPARTDSIYSDGSIFSPTDTSNHINAFANMLLTELRCVIADVSSLEEVTELLPELLQTFAMKLGYTDGSEWHRKVMVFVHKHRW
jgi:hypothetical protein